MRPPGILVAASIVAACGYTPAAPSRAVGMNLINKRHTSEHAKVDVSRTDGQITLMIKGTGFHPKDAYTLWLLNMSQESRTGVGVAPYRLPVAPDGTLNAGLQVAAASLRADWDRVSVSDQPSGDASSLLGAREILDAWIPAED